MALYSRLFKYAPLPNRTPLENFLTESLCDCLERMTALGRETVETFVVECLAGSQVPSSFRGRLTNARNLSWKTQHSFYFDGGRGCLDLCLFADNQIILVIENKVAAGFTIHALSPDDEAAENAEGGEELSQLDFYGRWLSAKYPGAGLVLLTHLTQAPATFLLNESNRTEASTTDVFHRVARWATVYEWIVRWQERDADYFKNSPQGIVLRLLTSEFLEFLEQNNMNATEMKKGDFELLNAYFAQDIWKKMRDLTESTQTLVSPVLPEVCRFRPSKERNTEAWEQTQIVWDWAYCYERDLYWYVGWGLAGQHGLRDIGIEFPGALQAFVVVTSDKADIPVAGEELNACERQGWIVYGTSSKHQLRLLKFVAPDLLMVPSERFNLSFGHWVAAAVKEGISLLENADQHRREREGELTLH